MYRIFSSIWIKYFECSSFPLSGVGLNVSEEATGSSKPFRMYCRCHRTLIECRCECIAEWTPLSLMHLPICLKQNPFTHSPQRPRSKMISAKNISAIIWPRRLHTRLHTQRETRLRNTHNWWFTANSDWNIHYLPSHVIHHLIFPCFPSCAGSWAIF